MLNAATIGAGDMPTFPSAAMSKLYFRLGWRVLAESVVKAASIQDQSGFVNMAQGGARLRWRATNPGTRPVSRFTRNTNTETSASGGRHKIISFKGPATGLTYPELEGGTRGVMRGVLTGA